MFIPFIASIVVILVITMYMSTSSIVADSAKVKMSYDKVTFSYPKEKIIVTAVESLCQSDPAFCKSNESGGVITLHHADLIGYIPDNFDFNDNGLEGSFVDSILVSTNYSTINLRQTIADDTSRYIYLNHYVGKEFGVSPDCVNGVKTSTPPCTGSTVQHDYPTSLEFRMALK